MTSRKILYAAGEPLGECATSRRLDGRYRCGGGGGSSSQSNPTTTNTDKRVAVSDGIGQSGDGSITYTDNSNSSDAVIALADAGAEIIKSSGGTVVELGKFQGAQNTQAWDTTITNGAKLIDKLIDKSTEGFALSGKVIDSFTPTENKNADIGKYAMIAAAVVAGAVLLKGK